MKAENLPIAPGTSPAQPTLNKETLLKRLMTVTDAEDHILKWAFVTLNTDEVESCLSEAKQITAVELRADDAHRLLVGVFLRVIVSAVRWGRTERLELEVVSGHRRQPRPLEGTHHVVASVATKFNNA